MAKGRARARARGMAKGRARARARAMAKATARATDRECRINSCFAYNTFSDFINFSSLILWISLALCCRVSVSSILCLY